MSRVSKVQLIVVQIFLIPAVTWASGAPKSLNPCDFMLNVSIEVLTPAVQARIKRALPDAKNPKLIDLRSFGRLSILGVVKHGDGWFFRGEHGAQTARPTDPHGAEVLRRSKVDSTARREVMTVVWQHGTEVTSFGEYADGLAFMIDQSKVTDQVLGFMNKFRARVGPQSEGYLRVIHSHPEYDVVGNDARHFVTNDLSELDVTLGKQLSLLENIPVVIEAVTPNGYSYAAAFFEGKNITDLTLSKNPLADHRASSVRVTHVDHMPGPSAKVEAAPGPLPEWLQAKYEEYKRTGVLPKDPSEQKFFLKMDKTASTKK